MLNDGPILVEGQPLDGMSQPLASYHSVVRVFSVIAKTLLFEY